MSLVAIKLLQEGIVPQMDMQNFNKTLDNQLVPSTQLEQTTATILEEGHSTNLPSLERDHDKPQTHEEATETNLPLDEALKETNESLACKESRRPNLPLQERHDKVKTREIIKENGIEDAPETKVPPTSPIVASPEKKAPENIAFL